MPETRDAPAVPSRAVDVEERTVDVDERSLTRAIAHARSERVAVVDVVDRGRCRLRRVPGRWAAPVVHPRRLGVPAHPRTDRGRARHRRHAPPAPGRPPDGLADPDLPRTPCRVRRSARTGRIILVLWATHLGIVLLVRRVCGRLDVSAWMTTLICSVLLVFGGGWENILFAIQITYNLSLLAFLAQFLLVDHTGPVDRRDWIGSGIAVIGVSSSGFRPVLRVRRGRAPRSSRTMEGCRGRGGSAGVRVVVVVADVGGRPGRGTEQRHHHRCLPVRAPRARRDVCQPHRDRDARRCGDPAHARHRRLAEDRASSPPHHDRALGDRHRHVRRGRLSTGRHRRRDRASSRYQYMAAMLLAPVFALGLDQAGRFAPWAVWLPRAMLVFALARNVMWLSDYGAACAARAELERAAFSLVAGSPDRGSVDPSLRIVEFSPDVRFADLDQLVDDGAITPVAGSHARTAGGPRRPARADRSTLRPIAQVTPARRRRSISRRRGRRGTG